MANTSIEVIPEMSFLSLNDVDIKFVKELEKLTCRFYVVIEVLFIINQVKYIDKKKFVTTVSDKNSEIFVMYIVPPEILTTISTHLLKISQVYKSDKLILIALE